MISNDGRTILVTLRFVTDKLDGFEKKHCVSMGFVRVPKNTEHDIPGTNSAIPFRRREDIAEAVLRALEEAGVTVHASNAEIRDGIVAHTTPQGNQLIFHEAPIEEVLGHR
jgi:hypothetical protein